MSGTEKGKLSFANNCLLARCCDTCVPLSGKVCADAQQAGGQEGETAYHIDSFRTAVAKADWRMRGSPVPTSEGLDRPERSL
jgi:hypothetical protein